MPQRDGVERAGINGAARHAIRFPERSDDGEDDVAILARAAVTRNLDSCEVMRWMANYLPS
jgi:hypothetical protein